MVSHHAARFRGHIHCGGGVIMFKVAKEEASRYSCFNPSLLFMSKVKGLK